MARIRTVKPEFWTSEQVMECSTTSRLLFIGMWNFCDDGGNHPASAKTLKAEVFPGDDFSADDVQAMVDELVAQELLMPYIADGKRYLHVTGWHHQKIEKPNYRYPKPEIRRPVADQSSNDLQPVDNRSTPEGKGREGSKPIPKANALGVAGPSSADPCPHQQIVAIYHETLPNCIPVKVWNEQRQGLLRQRWREDAKRQRIEWWQKFFAYVGESEFLTGRGQCAPGRDPFVADLEWLIRPQNFAKVIEGKYHRAEVAA